MFVADDNHPVRGAMFIAASHKTFGTPKGVLMLIGVGTPVLFIVGAGSLFLWCSARLTRLAESTSHS